VTAGGFVVAVALDGEHRFSKRTAESIRLVQGVGVAGDAHAGVTVQHRSRVARDPSQPNLRQVHLIHAELLDEVDEDGFTVPPGAMGENVTTRGLDLLGLATGTVLELGDDAAIEVTGLRNPCLQIDAYEHGLLKRMVGRDADGNVVRRAGVMAVVLQGGVVRPGDRIRVQEPAGDRRPLQAV
jgi:MOSC domain-containing protein YiiM